MSNKKIWIRHRGNKFVVVKIVDGKQEQVADFPNKTLAKDYVSKVRHYLETELQVDMPEPPTEDIEKIMQKCQQQGAEEKKNYAGQGSLYYDV